MYSYRIFDILEIKIIFKSSAEVFISLNKMYNIDLKNHFYNPVIFGIVCKSHGTAFQIVLFLSDLSS